MATTSKIYPSSNQSCIICTASMRTDHYGEHMLTHIREILVRDKLQREESIENKSVCVYLRHLKNLPTTGPQELVSFACCLVCGKWEQNVGRKGVWKCLNERWCRDCNKPHKGAGAWNKDEMHCSCPGSHLPRPQNCEPNECEIFIDKHNAECAGGYDRIAEWFDLKKPKPKSIPVVRKTAQKRTQKTKTTTSSPTPPTSSLPDLVAKAFPIVFDHYYYQTDEDSDADPEDIAYAKEERHTDRSLGFEQMINKAGKSYDQLIKRVQMANKIKQDAIVAAVNTKDKELDQMEQKLFREQHESAEKSKRIQLLNENLDLMVAEMQKLTKRLAEYEALTGN